MKKLVITALVLAAVLLVADYAAAAAAEHRISQQLQEELDVPDAPTVRIHGFPFLTQAISGHYERIEMSVQGLDVGPLNDVAVEATMRDVHAPLLQVLTGDMSGVRIEHVQGRVRINESDLGQVIGLEDLQIAPAAGRAAVRMSATVDVGAKPVKVIVIAQLELVRGAVQISPVDVRLDVEPIGVFELPETFRKLVMSRFAVRIDPGGLPFTVRPTSITVHPGSIVVAGTASGVTLGQAGLSQR